MLAIWNVVLSIWPDHTMSSYYVRPIRLVSESVLFVGHKHPMRGGRHVYFVANSLGIQFRCNVLNIEGFECRRAMLLVTQYGQTKIKFTYNRGGWNLWDPFLMNDRIEKFFICLNLYHVTIQCQIRVHVDLSQNI